METMASMSAVVKEPPSLGALCSTCSNQNAASWGALPLASHQDAPLAKATTPMTTTGRTAH
jgi:hypothetical protein